MPKLTNGIEFESVVDYCFHYSTNECRNARSSSTSNTNVIRVDEAKCDYCHNYRYHGFPLKDLIEWYGLQKFMIKKLNQYGNKYTPLDRLELIFKENSENGIGNHNRYSSKTTSSYSDNNIMMTRPNTTSSSITSTDAITDSVISSTPCVFFYSTCSCHILIASQK